MKRFFLVVGVVVFGMLGVVSATQSAYAQSTDNFTINSFEADYYLDKDSEGRSTLKTVEKITAVFPSYDQNHGIERAIPQKYDDHSTHLRVESVKDGSGNDLDYSDSNSNDNLVLRIGNGDEYVHGTQQYVITYTQRDVTRFFSNTNADEFYWDVNGTQWAQPMNTVSARVHIGADIASQLNGKTSCYQGVEGSTDTCVVTQTDSPETVLSADVSGIGPYENVTLAIGFTAHTFAEYQPTAGEKFMNFLMTIWVVGLIIGSIAAAIAITIMSVRYRRVMRRAKGRGGILVAEYLPPKNASVLLSAQVVENATTDITAQLIDLAVRHYLKIYQTKDKTLFKVAEYEIEIVKSPADLSPEEQQLLKDLFGKNPAVGSRFAMKALQNNYSLARQLLKSRTQLRDTARGKYQLFERAESEGKGFMKFGFLALLIGVLTLSPLVVIAAIIAFILAGRLWPLTEKGAELRDYLAGLREYITVAESDRIKMLQSPEGAEKIGAEVDGSDTALLVKLYERVLPYAVLFGIEKQWTKQLGAYYESSNSQPDWYSGNGAFNAVVFSSALGNFSSQTSSYSSSASSSSGGSDGGGSSGGGGGGGGGGGW